MPLCCPGWGGSATHSPPAAQPRLLDPHKEEASLGSSAVSPTPPGAQPGDILHLTAQLSHVALGNRGNAVWGRLAGVA